MPVTPSRKSLALLALAASVTLTLIACGVEAPRFAEAGQSGIVTIAEQSSQTSGPITSLVMAPDSDGERAYMAAGNEIFLMDVSDPLDISISSRVGSTDERIFRLFASEGYVTAVYGEETDLYDPFGKIAIFERISEEQLRPADTLTGAYYSARTTGDYLYAVSYETGLTVFDLAVNGPPDPLGNVNAWESSPGEYGPHVMRDAVVSGGMAYVASGDAGLGIVDISDPSSPRIVTTMDLAQGDPRGYLANVIASEGTTLLVGDNISGKILRLDVSDPESPRITGEAVERQRYGGYGSLTIDGDTGYFVAWTGDWVSSWRAGKIDLSAPDEISISGPIVQNGIATDVIALDDYVLVAGWSYISALDFRGVKREVGEGFGGAVPEAVVAKWQPWTAPATVHIKDQFVYSFTAPGLFVYDTGTPGQIRQLAHVPLNGRGPMFIEDETAYFLLDRTDDTEVRARLDLSDPSNPVWLDPITMPRFDQASRDASTDCPDSGIGDVCYLVRGNVGDNELALGGSSPAVQDFEFQSVFIPGSDDLAGADVKTQGDRVFLFDGKTVFIFDASDPLKPELVGQVGVESEPRDDRLPPRMEVEGDHIFALYNRLSVIDMSDPRSLEVVATHQTDAMEMAVKDSTLFLVNQHGDAEFLRYYGR